MNKDELYDTLNDKHLDKLLNYCVNMIVMGTPIDIKDCALKYHHYWNKNNMLKLL